MSKIITFANIFNLEDIAPPEPANKNIPDWYKDLESYIGGEKKPNGQGNTTATIKKCMPVFDAMTAGYIIKSIVDVYVSQKPAEYSNGDHFNETGEDILLSEEEIKNRNLPKTNPYYEWPSFGPINFHPIEQAPNHPNRNNHQLSYPKWMNAWTIKTPPGYSTLFVQPWHRESIFTIFPGIVDTDQYGAAVNFPFVLNDPTWEGLIPAGTPIAQVIPFKRESWEMKIGDRDDIRNHERISVKLRTKFFDSYKNEFRSKKEYR